MAGNKDSEQSPKKIPEAFDEHEKNMDGSDREDAPYQENRKIGSAK